MSQTKTTFGERLRIARRTAGITQQTLAGAVGVSVGTVANWELGREPAHLPTVARVAERLSVDPGWLAFGRGAQTAEASP